MYVVIPDVVNMELYTEIVGIFSGLRLPFPTSCIGTPHNLSGFRDCLGLGHGQTLCTWNKK